MAGYSNPYPTLFSDKGRPLFTGTSVGQSPYNTGTASGLMPNMAQFGWFGGLALNSWKSRHMPFTKPNLSQLPTAITATLAARRRLAGSTGVGSTFLTGPGGVKPGSQSLGYTTLLGQ